MEITDFSKVMDMESDKASLEDLMAILSHYVHNHDKNINKLQREKVISIIQDYIQNIKETSDNFCNTDIVELSEPSEQYNIFQQFFNVPFPTPKQPKFTFIDLFAGIGGFRIAMQNIGGECVFSSEWDKLAQKTYFNNFGDYPFGDITKESTKKFVPNNFDVLCAGFPCQAFSIAGYRKGFEDTRGTLFFDVAEIIKSKKPKVVFLENVKNLLKEVKPDIAYISNHGGRVETRIGSTAEFLQNNSEELKKYCGEVWVDGGIRGPLDIATAMALGANRILVGRPFVTAFCKNGESGLCQKFLEFSLIQYSK